MANVITNLRNCARSLPMLGSAARTATPDTFEFEGLGRKAGLVVVFDVTAVTSTPSVTVKIEGVDRANTKTWTLLSSAAIATTGTTVLQVHPAIANVTNVAASSVLPPVIRVTATHGNANSITYTLTGFLAY